MAYFNLPFGVRVSNNNPLDGDRYIAADIASRDQLIVMDRAYEGLQVYVIEDKVLYILKSVSPALWQPVGTDPSILNGKLNNTTDTFNGILTINGSINLFGDIYQDGSMYVVHAEQILTKDDFIVMRDEAVIPLPDGSISGLKIVKPDGTNNVIFGAGNDAVLRIGWENDILEAIATREDNPGDGYYAYWDSATSKFMTYDLKGNLDASIQLINNHLQSLDSSIQRIDVSLNNVILASELFYTKEETNGLLDIIDSSIISLDASIQRIDLSINDVVEATDFFYNKDQTNGMFIRSSSTGYGLFWINGSLDVSISSGQSLSGTPNYVPIFNNTGNNLIDSSLFYTAEGLIAKTSNFTFGVSEGMLNLRSGNSSLILSVNNGGAPGFDGNIVLETLPIPSYAINVTTAANQELRFRPQGGLTLGTPTYPTYLSGSQILISPEILATFGNAEFKSSMGFFSHPDGYDLTIAAGRGYSNMEAIDGDGGSLYLLAGNGDSSASSRIGGNVIIGSGSGVYGGNNGNIILRNLKSSVKNKVLYFDADTSIISYGDPSIGTVHIDGSINTIPLFDGTGSLKNSIFKQNSNQLTVADDRSDLVISSGLTQGNLIIRTINNGYADFYLDPRNGIINLGKDQNNSNIYLRASGTQSNINLHLQPAGTGETRIYGGVKLIDIIEVSTNNILYYNSSTNQVYFGKAPAGGGIGDVTKAYVDGSLAVRDASIQRIDVSLNDVVIAEDLFYGKSYIDGSLGLRDSSISRLFNSITRIDASIVRIDTSLNNVVNALDLFYTKSNIDDTLAQFIRSASTGSTLKWTPIFNTLDVSILFSDLPDVNVQGLADNDILVFDGNTQHWVNKPIIDISTIAEDASMYFQTRLFYETPTSSTSSGEPGQWSYDSSYLYICASTNRWGRVLIDFDF